MKKLLCKVFGHRLKEVRIKNPIIDAIEFYNKQKYSPNLSHHIHGVVPYTVVNYYLCERCGAKISYE